MKIISVRWAGERDRDIEKEREKERGNNGTHSNAIKQEHISAMEIWKVSIHSAWFYKAMWAKY